MDFFLDRRLLILLVPAICVGASFAGIYADDSIKSFTDKSVASKKITLSDIPDGSRVDSAAITITPLGNPSKTCAAKIVDPILDDIHISQKFPCYGSRELVLNERGVDAIEYNLPYNQARFEVVDMNGNAVPFDMSGLGISYSAPTYFAKIENGMVANVLVADQSYVDSLSGEWVQTFLDGSSRGNYAGVGYVYNKSADAFYEPQPYPSWKLDQSYDWQPPVPYPDDGEEYFWDEGKMGWTASE